MPCFNHVQVKAKEVLAAVKSTRDFGAAKSTISNARNEAASRGFTVVSGRKVERPEWIQSAMAKSDISDPSSGMLSLARGGRDEQSSRATSVDARDGAVAAAVDPEKIGDAVKAAGKHVRVGDRWGILPGDEESLEENMIAGDRMMPAPAAAEGVRHDSAVVANGLGSLEPQMTSSPAPDHWLATVANYSSTPSLTSSSSSSRDAATSVPATPDEIMHIPVTEPVSIPADMISLAMLHPQRSGPKVAFPPSHQTEVEMAAVPKAERPRYRQTRFVEVGLVDAPIESK